MTRAQHEALETGGLDGRCLTAHEEDVCPHCGACRSCRSGCGCYEEDEERFEQDCSCGGCEEWAEEEAGKGE